MRKVILWHLHFKVDLFENNPVFGNVDIDHGVYSNVNVKLDLKQAAKDSSLHITGIYTSPLGASMDVVSSVGGENEDFAFLVKAKNKLGAANEDFIDFLNLRLHALLSGVKTSDINAATLTNGMIVINSISNTSIYTKIAANINNLH